MSLKNTYWAGKGKYQAQSDALDKLIPSRGECPKKYPALEALRVGNNAYYDLYNNGGGNRDRDIIKLAGLDPNLYQWGDGHDCDTVMDRWGNLTLTYGPDPYHTIDELAKLVEPRMDQLILAAWAEHQLEQEKKDESRKTH